MVGDTGKLAATALALLLTFFPCRCDSPGTGKYRTSVAPGKRAEQSSAPAQPRKCRCQDVTNIVKIGMHPDSVRRILGKPDEVESGPLFNTGLQFEHWWYNCSDGAVRIEFEQFNLQPGRVENIVPSLRRNP